MGLFDFVADFGKKLFHKVEDAPQKIRAEIENAKLGVHDLQVSYAQGMVTLSGKVDSRETLEKVVLIAGNIQGVTGVNVDNLIAPPLAAQVTVEYYVIEKGDNLSKIAKRFLGDANRFQEIFEANREVIQDPNLIYPGQKIRIPVQ